MFNNLTYYDYVLKNLSENFPFKNGLTFTVWRPTTIKSINRRVKQF